MVELYPHLLRDVDGAPASSVDVADPPTPAGSDIPDQSPEKPDATKPEPMVPYGALKEERQARRRLEQQVSGLTSKIDTLMERITAQPSRGSDAGGLDPNVADEWDAHLQKLPLVQRLLKSAEFVEQIAQERPRDRVSIGIAHEMYQKQLTEHAMKSYDDSFPVSDEVYAVIVADRLTPQRMHRLFDLHDHTAMDEAIQEAVQIAKKGKPAKPKAEDLTRERDMTKLRNLPKPPGPGGATPPPAEEPKVVGKALHDRAHNRLAGLLARKE